MFFLFGFLVTGSAFGLSLPAVAILSGAIAGPVMSSIAFAGLFYLWG